MNISKEIKKLCQPAYVYLVISMISIAILIYQNIGNTNEYCVGNFSCQVSSTVNVFIVKTLYVIFWTFVLHSICKAGYKKVSWFLVLVPIILIAILIGAFLLKGGSLM
jgi:hypothetical protein